MPLLQASLCPRSTRRKDLWWRSPLRSRRAPSRLQCSCYVPGGGCPPPLAGNRQQDFSCNAGREKRSARVLGADAPNVIYEGRVNNPEMSLLQSLLLFALNSWGTSLATNLPCRHAETETRVFEVEGFLHTRGQQVDRHDAGPVQLAAHSPSLDLGGVAPSRLRPISAPRVVTSTSQDPSESVVQTRRTGEILCHRS